MVAASTDATGASGEESPYPAASTPVKAPDEHSEFLVAQMKKCVLVHHQLSCLLIHSAALQAGIYNIDDALGDEGQLALRGYIQNLGGSTARLFSMALHDHKDLQSMGDTLRERVDDMVGDLEEEGILSGTAAANLSDTSSVLPVLSGTDEGAESAATRVSDQLAAECVELESLLKSSNLEVENLQREIEAEQQSSAQLRNQVMFHGDKVQAAQHRAMSLDSALRDLVGAGLCAEAAGGQAARAARELLGSAESLCKQPQCNASNLQSSVATRLVSGAGTQQEALQPQLWQQQYHSTRMQPGQPAAAIRTIHAQASYPASSSSAQVTRAAPVIVQSLTGRNTLIAKQRPVSRVRNEAPTEESVRADGCSKPSVVYSGNTVRQSALPSRQDKQPQQVSLYQQSSQQMAYVQRQQHQQQLLQPQQQLRPPASSRASPGKYNPQESRPEVGVIDILSQQKFGMPGGIAPSPETFEQLDKQLRELQSQFYQM